jgi:hypothetical protein
MIYFPQSRVASLVTVIRIGTTILIATVGRRMFAMQADTNASSSRMHQRAHR